MSVYEKTESELKEGCMAWLKAALEQAARRHPRMAKNFFLGWAEESLTRPCERGISAPRVSPGGALIER